MKKKKLRKNVVIVATLSIVILLGLTIFFTLLSFTGPVSKDYMEKTIVINQGMTTTDIVKLLKDNKLIKNEKVFYYYLRIKNIDNIYAASYILSPDMNMDKIIKVLQKGGENTEEIEVVFIEGMNIKEIAKKIASETNNTEKEVLNLVKNKEYQDELISNYWFITDEIKNKELFYSLEGYLFPDTYMFNNRGVTVKEIFTKMLDETENVLNKYKKEIDASDYSVHELLSIASMIQMEGLSDESRSGIAGVIYNRLDSFWRLDIDATTYYAFGIELGTRDLTQKELDTYHVFNTRGPNMTGKLIPGPISNAGEESIKAAIKPENNKYYFYVSDKNGKIYFTKTETEHNNMIAKLKNEGLWFEW